jgi:hypothetical protein
MKTNKWITGIQLWNYTTDLPDGTKMGFDADFGIMFAYEGKLVPENKLPSGIKRYPIPNNKKDVKPLFVHDCEECKFLATVEIKAKDFDMYYCEEHDLIIARFGDDGLAYMSISASFFTQNEDRYVRNVQKVLRIAYDAHEFIQGRKNNMRFRNCTIERGYIGYEWVHDEYCGAPDGNNWSGTSYTLTGCFDAITDLHDREPSLV